MTELPISVEVTFLIPGFGPMREVYAMMDASDCACWHVNAGTYPQISVRTLESVSIPDDNQRRIAAFHRLSRMRRKAGKRLGLTLRKGEIS